MTISVMHFDKPADCNQMAVKFNVYVANKLDAFGCEMTEQVVYPKGKTLHIDRAYLETWKQFESKGYQV